MTNFFNDELKHYIFAAFVGSAISIAFPPYKFGFVAYIALIPLLIYGESGTLKKALYTGYWWGFGYQTSIMFWILNSTIEGGLLTFFYLPIYTGLALFLYRWTYMKLGNKAMFLFPFIWTSIEYFRSLSAFSFTWTSIGNTQSYFIYLIQFIDITGIKGVTFFICIVNVIVYIIYISLKDKTLSDGSKIKVVAGYSTLMLLVFLIPIAYSNYKLSQGLDDYKKVKISMIQGHIDTDDKEDPDYIETNYKIYEQLTKDTISYNPDLIVWPETATSTHIRTSTRYNMWLKRIIRNAKVPLLTGTLDHEYVDKEDKKEIRFYNSAVLFKQASDRGSWYEKIKLVPFGEWFPYEDKIPFVSGLDFGVANFSPGSEYDVFEIPIKDKTEKSGTNAEEISKVKFSPLICFESSLSGFVREFVKNGAEMLIVITNDNWFGRTSSSFQHAQFAALRAIENRVGVAHCSNSGISVISDPYGRITSRSNFWAREVLNGEVYYKSPNTKNSFFVEYGEVFSMVIFALTLFSLIGVVFVKP